MSWLAYVVVLASERAEYIRNETFLVLSEVVEPVFEVCKESSSVLLALRSIQECFYPFRERKCLVRISGLWKIPHFPPQYVI